uniref:Uncharacterized protein n=1 Tax=Anguilla anguilla TaxID=7936 RepID=A0A0E9U186_ANGAN
MEETRGSLVNFLSLTSCLKPGCL